MTDDQRLDVSALQFIQRVKHSTLGGDWWEAVSIDNPAIRVQRPTFESAIRQLNAKRATRDRPDDETDAWHPEAGYIDLRPIDR